MTKETWVKHIEQISGLIRPSLGGDKIIWRDFVRNHISPAGVYNHVPCKLCKERQKTRKANANANIVRQVYKDMGLTRVVGQLGGVYYE